MRVTLPYSRRIGAAVGQEIVPLGQLKSVFCHNLSPTACRIVAAKKKNIPARYKNFPSEEEEENTYRAETTPCLTFSSRESGQKNTRISRRHSKWESFDRQFPTAAKAYVEFELL